MILTITLHEAYNLLPIIMKSRWINQAIHWFNLDQHCQNLVTLERTSPPENALRRLSPQYPLIRWISIRHSIELPLKRGEASYRQPQSTKNSCNLQFNTCYPQLQNILSCAARSHDPLRACQSRSGSLNVSPLPLTTEKCRSSFNSYLSTSTSFTRHHNSPQQWASSAQQERL